MDPLQKAYFLLRELGPVQLAENIIYRLQQRSGWFERKTPAGISSHAPGVVDFSAQPLFVFAWLRSAKNMKNYIALANETVAGNYHPFSGPAEKLDFTLPSPLLHWTKYGDTFDGRDIKTIWEPARFIWVLPLCIAYSATRDEKYPKAFWNFFESFIHSNPVNMGPNWSSAQEVSLRLLSWIMAGQVFGGAACSTPERIQGLSDALWQHILRITLSLHYARSQHNNHWLSEALGLMLGGWLFRSMDEGRYWLDLGASEFQKGILATVEKDGTFSQHSTIYHRMLLQLSLVFQRLASLAEIKTAPQVEERLAAATQWLAGQMDLPTGKAANLGHNDGTDLLPVGSTEYDDFRPVLQASSRAFLGGPCLSGGAWDELSMLLSLTQPKEKSDALVSLISPISQRIEKGDSWASLRAPKFTSRPAHADLLHVELWHKGEDIALDAGTYAYNMPAPWENSLGNTCVHNTVTVNGQDQMFRAGKFLWLKRINAVITSESKETISARASFKTDIPYTQIRTIKWIDPVQLEAIDEIEFNRPLKAAVPVTVHWLMPDARWKINGNMLAITGKNSSISLSITATTSQGDFLKGNSSLVRAGETMIGSSKNPIRGWVSPTYLNKSPALSFSVEYLTKDNLQIKSLWLLDKK